MTDNLIQFPRSPWELPPQQTTVASTGVNPPAFPTATPAFPTAPNVDEQGDRQLTSEEDQELVALYREYAIASRALAATQERVDAIDAKIRELLGSAKFSDEMPDGGKITWTPPTRSKRLDKKAFTQAHPDIVRTYETLSEKFKVPGDLNKGTLKITPPKAAPLAAVAD